MSPVTIATGTRLGRYEIHSLAGTLRRSGGGGGGILVYSFDSHTYEKLTDAGIFPVWLNEPQIVVYRPRQGSARRQSDKKGSRDTVSRSDVVGQGFSISRDDRVIYYHVTQTEPVVWLMTLE